MGSGGEARCARLLPSTTRRSDPPSKLHCWGGLSCRNAEPCGFTFYTATETVALVRPRWRVVSTVEVRAGVLP